MRSPIRSAFASMEKAVVDVLKTSGFFEIEGRYNANEFMASMPLAARQRFRLAVDAKNRRIWKHLQNQTVSHALVSGAAAVARDHGLPLPSRPSRKYLIQREKEFRKYMNASDQSRLKKFIKRNATQTARPSENSISGQPWIASMLDTTGSRTANIQDCEADRAYHYGGWEYASQQGGLKTRVEIIDRKTRPDHRHMAGETVSVDRPYSNGEMYPGEHSIGCRGHSEYVFTDVKSQVEKSKAATPTRKPIPKEGSFKIDDPLEGEELVTLTEEQMFGKKYGIFPNGHQFYKSTHRGVDIYESVNRESGGDERVYGSDPIKAALDMVPETVIKKSQVKMILASPIPDPRLDPEEIECIYGKGFGVSGQLNLKTHIMTLFPDYDESAGSVSVQTLAHELAHGVDYNPVLQITASNKSISSSRFYVNAIDKDYSAYKEGKVVLVDDFKGYNKGDHVFVSSYAETTYNKNGLLDEDFADFVGNVVSDPRFRKRYPNRYEELQAVLGRNLDSELDKIDEALDS